VPVFAAGSVATRNWVGMSLPVLIPVGVVDIVVVVGLLDHRQQWHVGVCCRANHPMCAFVTPEFLKNSLPGSPTLEEAQW